MMTNAAADMVLSLERVKEYYHTAILAGGAVRDYLNDKPISDYDIFIQGGRDQENVLKRLCAKYGLTHSKPSEYSKKFKSVTVNFADIDKPVQLIFLDSSMDPKRYVQNTFDYGICMCYFDLEKVHVFDEYKRDVDNKTITLYADRANTPFLVCNHFKKIQTKYPDFEGRIVRG